MAYAIPAAPAVPTIELRRLLPWLLFFGLLACTVTFFVATEQTALLHEFVHDGRHLLGYPCH